ncbi:MAG: hypothetical protein CUN54_10530 [Phototrophicales bacterium]|nr:MAG: hypothetical protein CUN54_10530 [Phototrophicales bacterium]
MNRVRTAGFLIQYIEIVGIIPNFFIPTTKRGYANSKTESNIGHRLPFRHLRFQCAILLHGSTATLEFLS